jgi:hypothetical protein
MEFIAVREDIMNNKNNTGDSGKTIKLLNRGTYGCVFKPGLTCDGMIDKSKTTISKTQKDKETSENELYVSKKIREITNYSRYFAPINESCEIDMGNIENNEINKCEFIYEQSKSGKPMKFEMNKLIYVGKNTLGNHLMQLLEKTKDLDEFAREFINSYKILLEGLRKLSDKDLIHHDIKENNIMCRDTTGRPILIDFGLSFEASSMLSTTSNELFDVFYAYSAEYAPWCVENSIISYILNVIGKDMETVSDILNLPASEELLSECIEEYFEKNVGMKTICNQIKCDEYKNNLKAYFSKMIKNVSFGTIKWKKIVDELIQYHNTWDVYSLTICYLQLFDQLKIEDIDEITFMREFKNMLLDILLTIPSERLDAKSCTNKLKKIQKVKKKELKAMETLLIDYNENKDKAKERREHYVNSKMKMREVETAMTLL